MASAPSAWMPRVMTIRPPRWCLRSASLSERTRSRFEVMMVSMEGKTPDKAPPGSVLQRTSLEPFRVVREEEGREERWPRLDQRHEPALGLGVAIDVALRRLNRAMASEKLNIPQTAAGQSNLAGRLSDEAASA